MKYIRNKFVTSIITLIIGIAFLYAAANIGDTLFS